jgi:AcrR family transcriptional regulator
VASSTRIPLSRERILGAALAVADDDGVDAVTMRRLGDELGFEAMSLYRHVANKDEVLDGILDLVLGETTPPSFDESWAAAIRTSAVSVRDALDRHPWATRLLMTPQRIRPARLAYMDSLLRRLREAGFSADTTYHAYHVLDAHIFGFALWLTTHQLTSADSDVAAQVMRSIPFDDYPYLREHRDQHMNEGPHHDVSAFEFGLDLILDGLQRVHTAEG